MKEMWSKLQKQERFAVYTDFLGGRRIVAIDVDVVRLLRKPQAESHQGILSNISQYLQRNKACATCAHSCVWTSPYYGTQSSPCNPRSHHCLLRLGLLHSLHSLPALRPIRISCRSCAHGTGPALVAPLDISAKRTQ
jgi:hypothetical protein